jgi:cAMP-regulated phosphoprotein/endosulfine conserved region
MNPHQKNKIDISVSIPLLPVQKLQLTGVLSMQSLSADEQRLFRLYGKLPNKKDLLQNKLKVCTHTLFL